MVFLAFILAVIGISILFIAMISVCSFLSLLVGWVIEDIRERWL